MGEIDYNLTEAFAHILVMEIFGSVNRKTFTNNINIIK